MDITMPTKYEINKAGYAEFKPLDPITLQQELAQIAKEFPSHYYWMLLCKERSDYTIFYDKKIDMGNKIQNTVTELRETLHNRGDVISIEYIGDKQKAMPMWEIWLKSDGQVVMYMLFECDDFIVEV